MKRLASGNIHGRMARLALVGAAFGFALLLAPRADAQAKHDDHGGHGSNDDPTLVEAVRDATKGFFDPRNAVGYEPFLGCVSGTQEGAMGVHYVNMDFVNNVEVKVDKPEALMYEVRNGKATLLGVEYIVDAEAWDNVNMTPPVLMGQLFTYNTSPNRFGLNPYYSLHVWAWRDNPNGAFVDWNPQVSCEGFVSKE